MASDFGIGASVVGTVTGALGLLSTVANDPMVVGAGAPLTAKIAEGVAYGVILASSLGYVWYSRAC